METIRSTKNVDLLDFFRDEKTWEFLTPEEKDELAFAFLEKGEISLKNKKNMELIDDLKMAASLSPKNPLIFFRSGSLFLKQDEDQELLTQAVQAFNKAIALDVGLIPAWKEKAKALLQLGVLSEDPEILQQVDEIYRYIQNQIPLEAEDFYLWGSAFYYLSFASQEAVEIRMGIEKFQMALDKGLNHPLFLIDYANALRDLGQLVGRVEMLFDAVHLYEKALKIADNDAAWLSLACVYRLLFMHFNQERYFERAEQCFIETARLNSKIMPLWLNWGRLLAHEGTTRRNPDFLLDALEKFEKANALYPNQPLILCSWADALMHLGAYEDRFDYIKDAQDKILLSLEIVSDDPDMWCVYGHCLILLGKYFADAAYFHDAIEQFKHAVSLDQTLCHAWHGMAMAHYAWGELLLDVEVLENAVRFAGKAIELGGDKNPSYWNDWGVALMKLSEAAQDLSFIPAAIEKFETALQIHSKMDGTVPDPDWLYNLGCAFDYLGDYYVNPIYYEKAIVVLAKLINQHPHYTPARYNLALSLYHLGDITRDLECLEKSIEQFEVLISLENEDDVIYTDFAVVVLTKAVLITEPSQPDIANGLYEFAEHLFMQGIALGSRSAYYYLACLYSLMNNYPEAMHFMEKAKANDSLPPVDEMMHDEWLEGLRQTNGFRTFLSQLSSRFAKEEN